MLESEISLQGNLTEVDLADAVARLREGGTLRLNRTMLRMHNPLCIEKPLTLVGQDMDSSWVVGPGKGEDFAVILRGPGPWFLRNLSVAQCGIKVEGGEIDVCKCRFAHCSSGPGLHIEGSSSGRVDDCEFLANRSGIVLAGQSDILVTGNLCHENVDGIAFQDRARGAVLNNRLRGNTGRGLSVNGLARPIRQQDLESEERPALVTPKPRLEGLETVLKQLIAKGRRTGQLSHDEINEALQFLQMTPDQFDLVLEAMVHEGIEIVDDED